MLTGIELTNFKNFKHADIPLGKFTVIVGANATGKSNIRDAMRFLHGLARGYTLAEIVDGVTSEGVQIWHGIRGGVRSLSYYNSNDFSISCNSNDDNFTDSLSAKIVMTNKGTLAVDAMKLSANIEGEKITDKTLSVMISANLKELIRQSNKIANSHAGKDQDLQSVLEDIVKIMKIQGSDLMSTLFLCRFADLFPERMRLASFRDQKTLGDQGENLSSAIYHIYQNPIRKAALMEWIAELTPMDVVDFEFPEDQIGRILVTFVEKDGRKTSAYSASDGTLRFLCYAAALLTEEPAKVHFFEELDNGIHPSRLHLLVQLIEKAVSEGKTQVIATTHSPQMLSYLSEETLQSALLVYRLPGEPDAKVKRIVEIPDAVRLIKEQGIARLHATGWLEDAVYLTEDAK